MKPPYILERREDVFLCAVSSAIPTEGEHSGDGKDLPVSHFFDEQPRYVLIDEV